MEVKDILKVAEQAMKRAIEHNKVEFGKVRTGRASSSLLDSVLVDYYGSQTPLSQVANVSTPDATMILVQPWEKTMIGPIEKAIQIANLGLNPSSDGEQIRIPVPRLSEERRKELAKQVKKIAEDTKIGVRNARRDAMDSLKKAVKDEHMSEDTQKDGEADVQKLTDRYVAEVDTLYKEKEQELMTV